MIKKNYVFITLIIILIILFLSSCATPNPMLNPPITTNKLLTIKVYFKDNIRSNFSYTYNNQYFNYNFYCALCFRFDQNLNNLNIDLWEHIFFFENGFKRFKRTSPSDSNSDTPSEWSNVITDTNSYTDNNSNILNFNIHIPDNIIGSPTIYNFIVVVFLRRDYQYNQMSDDFGQNPIDFYGIEYIQNIIINTSNANINQTYELTNEIEDDLNNLPEGFLDNYGDSLDITKIEYIIRQE